MPAGGYAVSLAPAVTPHSCGTISKAKEAKIGASMIANNVSEGSLIYFYHTIPQEPTLTIEAPMLN